MDAVPRNFYYRNEVSKSGLFGTNELKSWAAFSFVILCSCESQFVICSVLRAFSAIAEIFSDCPSLTPVFKRNVLYSLFVSLPAVVERYSPAAKGRRYRCPTMSTCQ